MLKSAAVPWPARRMAMAGVLSALLLLLPFPLAGPAPFWRTYFSWIAFAPLLWAILSPRNLTHPRYALRSAGTAYLMGVLWYTVNCDWIYRTMLYYGGLPASVSVGILALYSLVLGLYFSAFGLMLAWVGRRFGAARSALLAAPFCWVAVEFLSSRFTRVPWDLLGYSQIDNPLLCDLAPLCGVFGLSFLIMAVNALVASALLSQAGKQRLRLAAAAVAVVLLLQNCDRLVGWIAPLPPAPTSALAVLVQPNLNVNQDNSWAGDEYASRVQRLMSLSLRTCGPYLKGMPELDSVVVRPDCPAAGESPDLIAWPESPAPFVDKDPRFLAALRGVAASAQAPIVAGTAAIDSHGDGSADMYNSALFVSASGRVLGRYDKVHLVPWGEYVPFERFFWFAKSLTEQAGRMTHGWRRIVFHTQGHTFGVFICYEEIFGDEIRHFVKNGAEVLVNLSDDGWYGDTGAPWQTLNMSRMRAVENRRWILRDTNTGLTTVIDPYGRLTASIPRHQLNSLAARFGYRSDITFYTRHGDVFAKLCGIIALALLFGGMFSSRFSRS